MLEVLQTEFPKLSQKVRTVIPSSRCSLGFVIRHILFISLLLCIPVVAAALLIFGSLSSFIGIIFTAPAITLCKDHLDRPSNLNSKISLSSFILSDVTHHALSCVSWYRAFDLLLSAAFGALNALVGVLQLSFSEEHVPYVACPVFILYYIWSSYSSFTKTYHELALTLYDCHKDSKRTQSQDVPSSSDQLPKLPNNTHDLDNVIAIPKELFEMACEKLLPLREGVCLLILKISVLVFSVFSWAAMFSFDTTPLMKTLLTFLTLAFPKIVAIYIDGGWQKKLRERVRKEKVPKIVEKFISRTSMTTRGQRDRNANIDEVNLVNEDCIELVVM